MLLVNRMIEAIGILFLAGLLVCVIAIICYYCFSFKLDDYYCYNEDYDSNSAKKYKDFVNDSLIAQEKQHTINYANENAKDCLEKNNKNKLDFDVDFDINIAGSIVKTETIYAE